MTIEEQIKYWFDPATEDLLVADSLFEKKHYSWCLFIGHLVIEKALKGHFVKMFQETPPKIHDLIKLSNKISLPLNDEMLDFLADLNDFQIDARYPEQKKAVYQLATYEFTLNYLTKIKELFEWLKSRI
ncbi:MAG: hypothetical protein HW421_3198 [Ignavibacteria bacterium]|nr:hypothetical protein [Ignavibacteria bacterium]